MQLWVARDEDGQLGFYEEEPSRHDSRWLTGQAGVHWDGLFYWQEAMGEDPFEGKLFWEDEPVVVEFSINRKEAA